ncbi:MAG: LytTR family DNA-binding domain-containing protein, partial [Pseudomonadota bacterium]
VEDLRGHVVQVHRSFAVGRGHIRSVRRTNSGDGEITLSSNRRIKLSRRFKDALATAAIEPHSGRAKATT